MKKIVSILEGKKTNYEDVEEIIASAYKQKIGPLISTLIQEKENDLPLDIRKRIHDDLEVFHSKVDLRLEYGKQIEATFRGKEIVPIFVKGFVLSQVIW